MTDVVSLRRAEPDDQATLLDLWVEAWASAMPGIDFSARRSWFAKHLGLLEVEGAVTVLAVQGFAADGRCAPSPPHPTLRGEAQASVNRLSVPSLAEVMVGFVTCNIATHYLDQLAVRPALRGSGLASLLIDEAKRMSPHRLELHVNQDNPRAVRFYTREGFRIIDEGRNPNSSLAVWHMMWRG